MDNETTARYTDETFCLRVPPSRIRKPATKSVPVPFLASVVFLVLALAPFLTWLVYGESASDSPATKFGYTTVPDIAAVLILLHASACCIYVIQNASK